MCRILWLNSWGNSENCFFLQLSNCNLCSFHSEDSSKMCPQETEPSQQCCFSIDQMISRWYDVLWRNKTRIDNRNECQNCRVILMKTVEWKMKLSPWKNNKVSIWIYQAHSANTRTHTQRTTSGQYTIPTIYQPWYQPGYHSYFQGTGRVKSWSFLRFGIHSIQVGDSSRLEKQATKGHMWGGFYPGCQAFQWVLRTLHFFPILLINREGKETVELKVWEQKQMHPQKNESSFRGKIQLPLINGFSLPVQIKFGFL